MAVARHFQTTVGTSATAIEGTQYPGWILKNRGGDTVYLGGSSVTTGTGFPIESGEIFSPSEKAHASLRGREAERLYGIASASRDIRVLIQGRPNV